MTPPRSRAVLAGNATGGGWVAEDPPPPPDLPDPAEIVDEIVRGINTPTVLTPEEAKYALYEAYDQLVIGELTAAQFKLVQQTVSEALGTPVGAQLPVVGYASKPS